MRRCRELFVDGTDVLVYYTGTRAEADHQIGGAVAHITFTLRTKGIKGKIQFITAAADDDLMRELQAMCHCQSANMLGPASSLDTGSQRHVHALV
jgi:hypothetical protein